MKEKMARFTLLNQITLAQFLESFREDLSSDMAVLSFILRKKS